MPIENAPQWLQVLYGFLMVVSILGVLSCVLGVLNALFNISVQMERIADAMEKKEGR